MKVCSQKTSLARMSRDDEGSMTVLGLFVFMLIAMTGAVALDFGQLYSARTQLQVLADQVGHAAIYQRADDTATLEKTGQKNLCLAGGVALNCVANSHLIAAVAGLENLWIQPAAGDAGGALGAALDVAAHQSLTPTKRSATAKSIAGSFLGPDFDDLSIMKALDRAKLIWDKPDNLPEQTAAALAAGQIVGHFDGRMEFGPRALGNQSILADPRPADMLHRVNRKIKFREAWRPFAPMVLKDHAAALFDGPTDSPYMLLVASLKPLFRGDITLAKARARAV